MTWVDAGDAGGRVPGPAVLVGYGRAGRELHHRALRAQFGDRLEVLVVDPALPQAPQGVPVLPTVAAAAARVPVAQAVFHVTTPPAVHLECVRELVALGARRIVLEKPIAPTAAEARELERLGEVAEILPVSIWPSSRITARVRELIAAGEIGEPVSLHMEQSKPRFARTAANRAHDTAFEVEMPHQVLLALELGGPARLLSALHWPLPLPDRTVPAMGGALLRLEHADGRISTLLSDLTAQVRRRHLRITGTRGELLADYPVSGEDPYGQLRIAGRPGREVIEDAPLDQFLAAAYARFADASAPAPGSLAEHRRTIDLLAEARETATEWPLEVPA
ncbi:Gfo/Idh/MocA family oxidoreductase [Kitasatospora sp. NPDC006697]|uniref:Gfo/Idh/MocA family oxidoreductase n=1 Tax=Kitasatospora sp. NPDC006697 TaxID=3364020 RepID=UPI0036C778B6